MDPVSQFLLAHAPLAIGLAVLAHLGKDILRDFLAKDSAAKLLKLPGDRMALAEQSAAEELDKVPDPLSLINSKK